MTKIPVSKLPVLIPIKVGGRIIEQRNKDGYINATAMCQAAGKEFREYNRSPVTKAFIKELSAVVGIPHDGLIQIIKGGNDRGKQGTFVHPQIAIHLAQWLSPKFAVLVSKWVFDWLSAEPDRQKWATQRERVRVGRKWFRDILEPRVREWHPRHGIAMCTNAMNREILECTAKEFKEKKNLAKRDLNRDIMTENELIQFELAEQTAGEIIEANDIYDKSGQKGQCYEICKETARTIHAAISSLKATHITAQKYNKSA